MTKTEHHLLSPVAWNGPVISERLMGINLELTHHVTENLLANRIRNSKFAGPADPQTGVVAEWQPYGMNMGGMHAKAADGMFMSPSQSQMLHCYTAPYGAGLVQMGVPIRKGENLEFKIWAKARHRPVRMQVSLRARPSRNEDGYANAEIEIDSSYWKCFSVRWPITHTDEQAVIFLFLKETGVVLIDQVSLEPVGSNGVDLDVQEAILRLNPPAIRFPGGCMSTNHHWRMGTGPRELRPALADPVFKGRTEYGFGTDEYLELTQLLGGALHITVNVGSETPQKAAEWAAYCHSWFTQRDFIPPPAYFQIGNEQYGPWETSHMTGGMYVETLRAFVPGIRQAYPGCRIIGLAESVSTGVAGDPDTPFRQKVLAHTRELVDVLALNRYKGQWHNDPVGQLQNAVDSVGKIRDDLAALAKDARDAGWNPKIALTEWNYWLHAAHWDGKNFFEPDDALHGIFFAGVLHAFFRMADTLEIASFYHLLNAMGLVVKSGGRVGETAIGTLFRIYRSALPGRLVAVNSAGIENLDCAGIARGKETSLFISHWGTVESPLFRLDEAFGEIVACQVLSAPDCYSPMKSKSTELVDRRIALPPLSVTKIEFVRA